MLLVKSDYWSLFIIINFQNINKLSKLCASADISNKFEVKKMKCQLYLGNLNKWQESDMSLSFAYRCILFTVMHAFSFICLWFLSLNNFLFVC